MENKIIYIEINDWDMSFKSSSLQNIFSDLREQNLDEIYFNYAIKIIIKSIYKNVYFKYSYFNFNIVFCNFLNNIWYKYK